jgi:hypothetical protein
VVSRPELGIVVPFGDTPALTTALRAALCRTWDRDLIRQYAQANTWDRRVEVLEAEFRALCPIPAAKVPPTARPSQAPRP